MTSIKLDVSNVTLRYDKKIPKPKSATVPDFEKGYYVVTNVFSNAENAANWSTTLRSMEYEPQTMQRPDTNLFYVFVAHGQDGVALYETLKNVRSKEFLKSAWMLKINMD